jgi:coenzyme F420 biosynthesis associated uncharacterized protein
MADPVAWDLAERVGTRIAGRDAFEGSYLFDSLLPDFEELTAQAEELVAAETGLRSLAGPARVRVTDRAGWIRANVGSFQRLLRPLLDKLDPHAQLQSFSAVTRTVSGAEVGALLGWMSTRVLGQYDQLLIEGEDEDEQDLVYYVGPNVLSLEKRFAFPPREFRLWLALHEVTHRAQFTGIPWMRAHFKGLVEGLLGSVEPDPARIADALKRAVSEARAGRNPLDEGGLVAMLASDEQRVTLDRIGGMMSLLEGHGDVTMDRAGKGFVPSAERFSRVLKTRRASQPAAAKALQKVLGLEAKMRQYEQGERFIAAVEAEGGPSLLARAWDEPDNLPSLEEIRLPQKWLDRVGFSTVRPSV